MRPPSGAAWRAAVPLALTAGFLAGWVELGVLGIRRFVLGHLNYTGWQTLWTTPLSWTLWMLPCGLLLAMLSRRAPALVSPRVLVFVPAFVAAFGVGFLFYPALHVLAICILALGISVFASRTLGPRLAHVEGVARRITWWGSVLVALAAVAVHGTRYLAERRHLAALPAPAAGAPNVLLIVLDAVRARNLSVYGYPLRTSPALEDLARRGVMFRRAFATAPWTLPTHSSLMTGRYPHELRVGWTTPLERDVPTLSEALSARGYRSAGFVGNLSYTTREAGLARGFGHYEDVARFPGELLQASSPGRLIGNNPRLRALVRFQDLPGRRRAGDIAAAFLRWQALDASRPFFAFLNLYDAHEPYLPVSPFDTAFAPPVRRRNELIRMLNGREAERSQKADMSPMERVAEERAYDGGIAAMDAEIARVLAELERRGVLQHTLVVVTADHGELFGEHDLFSHGNALYLPLLHVPLLMALPGRLPAGAIVSAAVSLRDVPSTVLALTGGPPMLPGSPLLGVIAGRDVGGSPVLAEVRPAENQEPSYPAARGIMRSIIDGQYQLIVNGDGREELYALADTAQVLNLASRPQDDSIRTRLRAALLAQAPRP